MAHVLLMQECGLVAVEMCLLATDTINTIKENTEALTDSSKEAGLEVNKNVKLSL
jgi:hypothetical protein